MNHADGRERVVDGLPYTIGELRYCARNEMAHTVADLLIRRTHLAFETRDHGLGVAPIVAQSVTRVVGGFAPDTLGAVEDYAREVERIFSIDS